MTGYLHENFCFVCYAGVIYAALQKAASMLMHRHSNTMFGSGIENKLQKRLAIIESEVYRRLKDHGK